ncbi:hypothetical protein MNBD_DELTA01-1607 [hydrothermal vent metagenome]|uniref:YHYH domain-containing protein n=1 Tax=hydrothermal vent metagenome TaxID=652676 RepID=A0A3B0QPM8_9ZZZZ
MKKLLLIPVVLMVFASMAFAHSGGTNACGGHNDRKRGGYHVHNYSKHCRCYPSECAKRSVEEKDLKRKIVNEKKRIKD